MATYLTLVNLVCKRLNEEVLTSSDFASAVGAHATIRDTVNAAIRDVSREYPEWPWNKQSYSFNTVAGTSVYDPAVISSTLGNIDWDTFYVARNDSASPAITAQSIPLIEYTAFAQSMRPADQQADSSLWAKPQFVIRALDNKIILSPFPDTVYSINFEGWNVTSDLSAHSDTCNIPDRYNYVIVDGALKYMYQFRSAVGEMQQAEADFKKGIREMLRLEIPNPKEIRSTMLPRKGYSWVATRTLF